MTTLALPRPPAGGWRSALAVLALLLLVMLGIGTAHAQTATARNFDHLKTGFALTGEHVKARCESCHINAVFKGTPRDCASCHQAGMRFARGNVVMSANHLPTQQSCDSCHTTKRFEGTKFNHATVAAGTCATCHNGSVSTGKPASHLPTSATCDTCHRTTAWVPAANFDHTGVVAGTCTACHGAGKATGKSANHMPTNAGQSCDDCHKGYTAWRPSAWNHTQMAVTAQCSSCHSGNFPPADGRPANHVPYVSLAAAASANCDTCHKGSFSTWANGKFHSNIAVSAQCSSCHTGSYQNAVGKPATPVHTGVTQCETCHGTTKWAGAKVDHSAFTVATDCVRCHDGKTATAKPALHMPVGATACLTCHSVSPAGWKPTKWTHTQLAVAGQCATCHSGGYLPADGKPNNHVPYQSIGVSASANCDACHKGTFTTWTTGRFHPNFSVSSGCATCHTGSFMAAVGKPATTVHTGVTTCEGCHDTTGWAGAKVNHSTFNNATNCLSCHNGSTAGRSKPATHMPVGTTNCFGCHNVSPQLWTPTKFNHTQVSVAGQCASCHSGAFQPADGRPTDHIPYQSVASSAAANCDSCHKGSFATWSNGQYHANYAVSSNCVACHTGSFGSAVGKPKDTVHATVTGNCEACHKTTASWTASVDHSTFTAATNCVSCHNGSTTGRVMPGTHIPIGATNCFACHTSTPKVWTPTKFNHTQVTVTAQCSTCHDGTKSPADGKPTNHVPYASVAVSAAANCDACHKGSFTTWANGRFHANYSVSTSCATCHTLTPAGSFMSAVGKPNDTTHAAVTGTCETCHKTTASWTASVDHSTFTAATNCVTCHNGSTTGRVMPGTHIPVGTTNCFACHTSTPKVWTPTKFNHTQVTVTAQCSTCHDGTKSPADGKPTNHVPYASVAVSAAANCDACHKGSFSTWANGRFHANYSVSASCATCHTLTPAGSFMSAVGKPNDTTHAAVTGTCETCHKTTASWTASVDHSTFTAATNCVTCHNGSTTGRVMPGTHIPVGTTNCFACHTSTPKVWTPTKFNHTQVTVTAQCATCHTGTRPPADGKPTNHIPYASVAVAAAANCDGCHKGSFSTWANGRFHANYSVSASCATCHTLTPAGSFMSAVGKPADTTHAAVTGNCETCHKTTSSWSASVDHSTFTAATNCVTCHNGSTTGRTMPGTHIPVGATNCFACHTSTPKVWTPTKFNHTQVTVTAQCATCHTGTRPPADGKPTNHIPYASVAVAAAANCDGCHKGSFTTWTNGRFHANYAVSTGCVTCHTVTPGGSYLSAVGKPTTANHTGVTGNCESCHKSTANWQTVTFAHSPANAVGTGTCDTCHNGTTAKGKDATHIPIPAGLAKCDSCHKSQASFATSVTMNHTVVATAQCKTCHNGAYTSEGVQGAPGKPTNHIPEVQLLNGAAMDCNACHTNTTSFTTMTMNHNASQGNGSGWCKACHQSGTNFLGNMEKKSLTHERSTGVTDCSQSGCHRPLGNKGTAYRNWD